MAIEVFNRYEHKYLIGSEDYKKITEVINSHMVLDKYNINRKPYTITNIYYDTPEDYLIRRSLSKPVYKEKLRLRSYGVPNKKDKVFLEIKKKFGGIVNKRRTALFLKEAYDFINKKKMPDTKSYMNRQVVKEIEYFLSFYKPEAKLYLAYDRIAYFEKDNADLRISFDTNIRSRRYNLKLEDGDYGEALLDSNLYLMEIKTSLAKPLWLTNMLTKLNLNRSSFSKYGTEFKRFVQDDNKNAKIAI